MHSDLCRIGSLENVVSVKEELSEDRFSLSPDAHCLRRKFSGILRNSAGIATIAGAVGLGLSSSACSSHLPQPQSSFQATESDSESIGEFGIAERSESKSGMSGSDVANCALAIGGGAALMSGVGYGIARMDGKVKSEVALPIVGVGLWGGAMGMLLGCKLNIPPCDSSTCRNAPNESPFPMSSPYTH